MSTNRSRLQSPTVSSLSDLQGVEVPREVAPSESRPTLFNGLSGFENRAISNLLDAFRNYQRIASLPRIVSSPGAGAGAGAEAGAGAGAEKRTRSKIFINGYFLTFDKMSTDRQRIFWRCEFKNTCNARLHTDIDVKVKERFVHEHNHAKASDDEIKLYGLDPSAIIEDHVYQVNEIANQSERRKIRKRVNREAAQKESELKKQKDTTSVTSRSSPIISFINSISEGQSSSAPMNEEGSQVTTSPSSTPSCVPSSSTHPPAANNSTLNPSENSSDDELVELAMQLYRLWDPSLDLSPRNVPDPTIHFQCFVSLNDASEEQFYFMVKIEQRCVSRLKVALQNFCGQRCTGLLLYVVTPDINVVLDDALMKKWDNDQFFLLNASNPSRWFLTFVPI